LPKTLETEKVHNELYYDPRDIDISIFQPQSINDEIHKLIKNNPVVFTQYYSFHSEVRKRYQYIDSLIALVCASMDNINDDLRGKIKEYGFLKLYDLFKPEIAEYRRLEFLNPTSNKPYCDSDLKLCGDDLLSSIQDLE